MTKKTKLPIEFRKDEGYSSKPGEMAFWSTNLDCGDIWITLKNGEINYLSVSIGDSEIGIGGDEKIYIASKKPYEREITTTAIEAIEGHWVMNAIRTIWKAVR